VRARHSIYRITRQSFTQWPHTIELPFCSTFTLARVPPTPTHNCTRLLESTHPITLLHPPTTHAPTAQHNNVQDKRIWVQRHGDNRTCRRCRPGRRSPGRRRQSLSSVSATAIHLRTRKTHHFGREHKGKSRSKRVYYARGITEHAHDVRVHARQHFIPDVRQQTLLIRQSLQSQRRAIGCCPVPPTA
jgi:hypothetical protein